MPDTSHKRLSLTLSPKGSSKSIPQLVPAKLDALIESPPLVFYGQPSASTGALLSGQLRLKITNENMAIEKFKMRLVVDVCRKKPFHNHCHDCQHQSTDITAWDFLQGPATFRRGEHLFPFSILLPGHLPATMKGNLSTIDYVLKAIITPKTGEPIKMNRILNVKRSIIPSDVPRQSIRIFPPTNLTAHVELPPVIHPIGESNVSFRLDGVIKRNTETNTQTHWKLKRMTWRLDETQKVVSPACAKHAAKLTKAGDDATAKKGIAHSDVRTIGSEEIKSGWKCDYSSETGSIEMEFPFGIRPDAIPNCDVKAEDGTEVSHALIVEMIVAEEFAPIRKPAQVTPTGAARVLRMHFNIVVTERSGLGISWDEEQPPLYDDVPASPPSYASNTPYEGEPIPNYEELETLHL